MLSRVEHEKSFITSGPEQITCSTDLNKTIVSFVFSLYF